MIALLLLLNDYRFMQQSVLRPRTRVPDELTGSPGVRLRQEVPPTSQINLR